MRGSKYANMEYEDDLDVYPSNPLRNINFINITITLKI